MRGPDGFCPMMNLPFIGQKYSRSGYRYVPDDQGVSTLVAWDDERSTPFARRAIIDWGNRPSSAWLLPDGTFSTVSIEPFQNYIRTRHDRLIRHAKGDVKIVGRYPVFHATDNGQRVWLDFDKSFTTYPVDFFDRIEKIASERRSLRKRKKKIETLPPRRTFERDSAGRWVWKAVDRQTGTVIMSGVEETYRDAQSAALLAIRRSGVRLTQRTVIK